MTREYGLAVCGVTLACLGLGCATTPRPDRAIRVSPVAPLDAASVSIEAPVTRPIEIESESKEPERPPPDGLFRSWALDKTPTLDAAPLTRVPALHALCTELRSKYGLPFGLRGMTASHVRSSCAKEAEHMLPPNWSFVAFRQTFTMPRHGLVTNVFARLMFQGRTILATETLEATGVMSMANGDASGRIDIVRVDRIDLVGNAVQELVFTLRYQSGEAQTRAAQGPFSDPDERKSSPFVIVVCDADGAWCTRPVGLGKAPPSLKDDEQPLRYAYSRGTNGLLVECTSVTSKPSELVLRLP